MAQNGFGSGREVVGNGSPFHPLNPLTPPPFLTPHTAKSKPLQSICARGFCSHTWCPHTWCSTDSPNLGWRLPPGLSSRTAFLMPPFPVRVDLCSAAAPFAVPVVEVQTLVSRVNCRGELIVSRRRHSLNSPVLCGWAGAVAKKERLSMLARHSGPHGPVP